MAKPVTLNLPVLSEGAKYKLEIASLERVQSATLLRIVDDAPLGRGFSFQIAGGRRFSQGVSMMGWSRPDEESRADYERDLRKHEPRPGEKDYVPHRLDMEIPTAVEIAEIVRNPNVKLTSAAELIEQYARTVASGAAVAATEEASKRFDAVLAAVKL